MPELRELCDRIERQVGELREKATVKQWANYSRPAFVNNVAGILPGLEELYSLFQIARNEMEKRKEPERPDLSAHIKDTNQLITVLKRNKELEEARIEKMKEEPSTAFSETITVPELYSDLEQKALSILLKSTYAAERMRVFDRKREPLMHTKAGQKSILDLLERKDSELGALRKKYEETRQNTFLGLVEKESSIETENELNGIARSLESRTALMRKLFEGSRETFSALQKQMAELEERINNVEDLESQAMGKTFELVTMLKKERDYTKKILMEIEHETIQLRNTYSKELLGLQEEKLSYRNELEARYEKELTGLRNELRQRAELLKHFQDTVADKEKKIIQLEEQIHELQLFNKALHKHSKVKEHFSGKKGKKK